MPSQPEERHSRQIATIHRELAELQASSRIVTTPEELLSLEEEVRQITNRLAAALLEQKVQASLDSVEGQEAEQALIKNHPQRLKSEGKKKRHRSNPIRR